MSEPVQSPLPSGEGQGEGGVGAESAAASSTTGLTDVAPTSPGLVTRFVASLRLYLRELGGEPVVIVSGACAVLILSHYQGSTNFFRSMFGPDTQKHPWASSLPFFWWFGWSLVLYLVVPLLLSWITRGSFTRKYGMGLGDWRAGLLISGLFMLIMVPSVYLASKSPQFAGHYPLAGNGAYTVKAADGKDVLAMRVFVLYELAYFLYFVGWEFLFRGWMLNGLLPRLGRGGAILCQMAPFALMHLGKPEAEALGSIVAGIALGILALRTRSFWYGAILHGFIAVWMDLLSAWPYIRVP